MRSERYFLPRAGAERRRARGPADRLYLLEGKFAYAEPLRLALQNLALGRPGFSEAPTQTAMRVEVLDPEYSPEMQGRLSKLEAAISKQRTVKFPYWSISRDDERERTLNPYALFQDAGAWYVVGQDLDARRAHLPRLPHPRRDPLRHAPRARLPASGRARRRPVPRPAAVADRRPQGRGPDGGRGRHCVVGAAHLRRAGASRTASSSRSTRAWRCSRRGSCARTAGPCRASPRSFGARSRARSRLFASATRGSRGAWPPNRRSARKDRSSGRPPRRARAVRGAAGAARVPARPLRRGARGRDSRRRPRRALPHPARGARGAPLAAEPRQLRRRLLRGLRGAAGRHRPRRQGALRRHLPRAAAADAARGPRDPAGARVRRADDRRRRALAARARAREARGDLRRVRARPDARAARRSAPRRTSSARSAEACASGAWSRSTT